VKRNQTTRKVDRRGKMVEVLTSEQLIEALLPWDDGDLFVCLLNESGRVLLIADLGEYLDHQKKKMDTSEV
jgi:hypothetical protein